VPSLSSQAGGTVLRLTNSLYRGFILARSTSGAIGTVILALVVLAGTFVLNHLGEKRRRAKVVVNGSLQSAHIAMDTFHHPYQQCTGRDIVGGEQG
jgi:hypothetical protein